jgi:hypothetical protein
VFLTSAGFFALHALATPGVIIRHANAGFDIAPAGRAGAGVAVRGRVRAAVRASPRPPDRGRPSGPSPRRPPGPARSARWSCSARSVAVLLVAWAIVSLADLPPLDPGPRPPRTSRARWSWSRSCRSSSYAVAAVRFYLLHRRAPAAVPAEPRSPRSRCWPRRWSP